MRNDSGIGINVSLVIHDGAAWWKGQQVLSIVYLLFSLNHNNLRTTFNDYFIRISNSKDLGMSRMQRRWINLNSKSFITDFATIKDSLILNNVRIGPQFYFLLLVPAFSSLGRIDRYFTFSSSTPL